MENINLDYNNTFTSLVNKYLPKIEEVSKEKKPRSERQDKYQYQELCRKLFPIYGKRIYTLPYEKWYTDYKLEKSHDITEKYCKGNIRYLIKVMKGLPY